MVANLEGRQHRLAEQLRRKGVRTKVVDKATLIDLPPVVDKEGCRAFRLPKEAANALLFLDCSESADEGDGRPFATVVCGLSGKALKPYYESRGRGKKYKRYARFSVPQAIVTVRSWDNKISIMKHRVEVVRPQTAQVFSFVIWNGKLESLPRKFAHYRSAAESAQAKLRCVDPHRLHFAA